ncbi:hypothetical protein UO65_6255 [Actinokineospora spheciospongiae]|uniref:Uncharacterized protein n=1 Tax=Actinokineospora spheciospongiae TaxID=909613 RepID=W7ICX0_9PSEU|nr:hypothetical protein UO65_6255 [Actinokineospora spheciospongiae]
MPCPPALTCRSSRARPPSKPTRPTANHCAPPPADPTPDPGCGVFLLHRWTTLHDTNKSHARLRPAGTGSRHPSP